MKIILEAAELVKQILNFTGRISVFSTFSSPTMSQSNNKMSPNESKQQIGQTMRLYFDNESVIQYISHTMRVYSEESVKL